MPKRVEFSMMTQANIRRENSMMPTVINMSTGRTRANSSMPCAFLRGGDCGWVLLNIFFMTVPLKKVEKICAQTLRFFEDQDYSLKQGFQKTTEAVCLKEIVLLPRHVLLRNSGKDVIANLQEDVG